MADGSCALPGESIPEPPSAGSPPGGFARPWLHADGAAGAIQVRSEVVFPAAAFVGVVLADKEAPPASDLRVSSLMDSFVRMGSVGAGLGASTNGEGYKRAVAPGLGEGARKVFINVPQRMGGNAKGSMCSQLFHEAKIMRS